ncbi:MAG: CheR family methyltransferase [Verrucomicrobiota bacterium]
MTALQQIEARINQAIGLDVRSVGASTLSIAVQARMRKRKIKAHEEYSAVLENSETELQDLIEEVVVPETWFFRDRSPFRALAEWVRNTWMPAHPHEALRLLSAPCSSGEEPFSLVMALLDAGLDPEQFSVEAIDISRAALERARQGVFGQNSFRGQGLEFRDKHFCKASRGWRLNESVLKQVQFRQANVLDPAFWKSGAVRNVIFCRNLLIYLDPDAQSRLLASIQATLSPDGLLFAGHAEAFICSGFGYEAAQMPMAFAFRKRDGKPGAAAAHPAQLSSPTPARKVSAPVPLHVIKAKAPAIQVVAQGGERAPQPQENPKVPAAADQPGETLLAEAQSLADAGRFQAAMEKCDAYLRSHGPSSRVFCLLGLIHDAAGEMAEAHTLYRKALYMEPEHCEALAHLALLARKSGDEAAARQFEKRVIRAQNRTSTTAQTA